MISVCMATYNGEKFVAEQLRSILSQLPASADDAEIVIADDGSVDKTLSIIQSFDDPRIRVVTDESSAKHLGPVYNFERALAAVRGDVIFLADQDDLWMPSKVRCVLEALSRGCLAVHDAEFFCEGVPLPQGLSSMWMARPVRRGVFRNWLKNSYTGCCMAFTREVLKAALPFPKNLPMHDQWIGLVAERMAGESGIILLKEPLIRYRLHKNNATHLLGSEGGCSAGFFRRLKWRADLLRALLAMR